LITRSGGKFRSVSINKRRARKLVRSWRMFDATLSIHTDLVKALFILSLVLHGRFTTA